MGHSFRFQILSFNQWLERDLAETVMVKTSPNTMPTPTCVVPGPRNDKPSFHLHQCISNVNERSPSLGEFVDPNPLFILASTPRIPLMEPKKHRGASPVIITS